MGCSHVCSLFELVRIKSFNVLLRRLTLVTAKRFGLDMADICERVVRCGQDAVCGYAHTASALVYTGMLEFARANVGEFLHTS